MTTDSTMSEFSIDHVAIAVASIAEARPTYELLTGASGSPVETVEAEGVNVAFIGSGPTRIELIEPASEESPLHGFLNRRGPGLHHVAFAVPDLDAAIDRLTSGGLRLVPGYPRVGAHGRRVAFLHPKSTGGVLVELVQH